MKRGRKQANPSENGAVTSPKPPRVKRQKKSAKGRPPAGGGKRFVLIIGDEGGILIFMHGAKVVRRLFAPSAGKDHAEAIVEIMRANPNVPVSILADVLDQQYIPQTFPPVSPLSIAGLVKRRLERDFQPEDLKGALQIGRDKTGRKEWKYLLVALSKTPLLHEWLDLLLELPNQMKGIYLTPVEATHYVGLLNKRMSDEKPRAWQLLISHHKVSGFRQVVMRDGKLVFTRVSQAIDDGIAAVLAGSIEQEIINTIEYLKRLDFEDNANLDTTIITAREVIDSLDLKRFGFGRAVAYTPLEAAEGLGLEQAALSADRFGDVVMAAAFGIHKKRSLRFANAYMMKLDKLYQGMLGLRIGGGLIALLLIGLAGASVVESFQSASMMTQAQSKWNQLQPELQKMKTTVAGLDTDVAFKSVVVAAHDAYVKDAPLIDDFIAQLAPLVTPSQRITSMVWDRDASKVTDAPTTPKPAGTPVEELPVGITLTVDFSGAGSSLVPIDAAADGFIAALTRALPQYDIKADTFSWRTDEARSEEAVVELGATSNRIITNPIATIRLRGIKKLPDAPAGANGQPPQKVGP